MRTSIMFPAAQAPHPKGRFDVSLSNPIHIAEFLPWILLNRGKLSVLIHPNTGFAVEDFTAHALWAGRLQYRLHMHASRMQENFLEERLVALRHNTISSPCWSVILLCRSLGPLGFHPSCYPDPSSYSHMSGLAWIGLAWLD